MRYILDIDPRFRYGKIEELNEFCDLPTYVCLTGEITEETARKFRFDLELAENKAMKSKQGILPIVIDTYGGSVYSLLSMIDGIKSLKLPVATIVESKAMSCGAILFTFGKEGYRFVNQHATVMIHDVSTHAWGKIEDVKTSATEGDRLNEMVYKMMAQNCGQPDSYFYDMVSKIRGGDLYLSPEDCVKHKLANRIHAPTLSYKVSVDVGFE